MSSLLGRVRSLRKQLAYLAGYVDFTSDDLSWRPAPRPLSELKDCQRPVLLLHGFFSTRRTLEVLERRLRRDGHCVFSLNLGGFKGTFNTRGIDDLADFVRAKVERIYGRNPGLGPLTIIGHSKGGLIGAYYVKRLGGWRRTRALLTLGTPHNGTPAAYAGLPFGLLARSIWQMTPMSPFVRRLHRGPWPPGVRFVSIYSRQDQAAPYPSTLIDTLNLPYLRNVEVDAAGHREFLYKKRVYDAILAEMRAGEASTPVSIGRLPMVAGATSGAVPLGAAAAQAP
jgi:pimeloyl-ACP methyl ester carboxylesterase